MSDHEHNVIDLADLEGNFQSAREDWRPEDKPFDGTPVPDGKYQCRIEAAELATSQNGNRMLRWTLGIVAGPHTKRKLWRQNMLQTPENFRWLLSDLHICGVSLERLADLPNRLADLLDRLIEVQVKNAVGSDGKPTQRVYVNKNLGKWTPDPNETATSGDAPGDNDIPF